MAFLTNAMKDEKRKKESVCEKGYVCTRLERAEWQSSHQQEKESNSNRIPNHHVIVSSGDLFF